MRWMTRRADVAGHVIGRHLTQDTSVQSAFDDVTGDIRRALPSGYVMPEEYFQECHAVVEHMNMVGSS